MDLKKAKKNVRNTDTGAEEDNDDSELDEASTGHQKDYFEDSFDDEIDFACDDDGNFREGNAKPGGQDEHEGSSEVPADFNEEGQNDQANFYVYEKMQIKSKQLP